MVLSPVEFDESHSAWAVDAIAAECHGGDGAKVPAGTLIRSSRRLTVDFQKPLMEKYRDPNCAAEPVEP